MGFLGPFRCQNVKKVGDKVFLGQNGWVYFCNEAHAVRDMYLTAGVKMLTRQLGTQMGMWSLHLGTDPPRVDDSNSIKHVKMMPNITDHSHFNIILRSFRGT